VVPPISPPGIIDVHTHSPPANGSANNRALPRNRPGIRTGGSHGWVLASRWVNTAPGEMVPARHPALVSRAVAEITPMPAQGAARRNGLSQLRPAAVGEACGVAGPLARWPGQRLTRVPKQGRGLARRGGQCARSGAVGRGFATPGCR